MNPIRPLLLALLLTASPAATAADLQIVLPVLSVPPGATLDIPIRIDHPPAAHGILAIDFVLPLSPAVIQSSASLADGFLQTWGAPFVSATPSVVAVAAAGITPVGTSELLLNTVRLTLSPAAIPGTDLPLAFSRIRFNEGTPSVVVVPGMLRVRDAGAVLPGAAGALALRVGPNPARGAIVIEYAGARSTSVELELLDLAGRRVRHERHAVAPAGAGRFRLDAPGAAGLHVVRVRAGTEVAFARVVVLR